MGTDREYDGFERRNFIRIAYSRDHHAVLTIDAVRFDVIDISEGGIRIANPGNIRLAGRVKGRLELLSGTRIDVEGRIEWRQGDEVGLLLRHPIPAALIQAELRQAILKDH